MACTKIRMQSLPKVGEPTCVRQINMLDSRMKRHKRIKIDLLRQLLQNVRFRFCKV